MEKLFRSMPYIVSRGSSHVISPDKVMGSDHKDATEFEINDLENTKNKVVG